MSQALFLLRFPGPCGAIAYVFGRDARSGSRLEQSLGRFRVVGPTVKSAEQLPQDWGVEEKPRGLKGERVSIATTAGNACLGGAAVSTSASQQDLPQAYGGFATAARDGDLTEEPERVNTDGWPATHGAWPALFAPMTVLWCLRQALLKGRDRAPAAWAGAVKEVGGNIWPAYEAPTKRTFAPRLRRWKAWAQTVVPESVRQTHRGDVCDKRAQCIGRYDREQAHRGIGISKALLGKHPACASPYAPLTTGRDTVSARLVRGLQKRNAVLHSALYPIIDLLQRVLRLPQTEPSEEKLRELERTLSQYRLVPEEIVPLLAARLPLSLPEGRYAPLWLTPRRPRQKTLEAILALLMALAAQQPVLLIVEDLHNGHS